MWDPPEITLEHIEPVIQSLVDCLYDGTYNNERDIGDAIGEPDLLIHFELYEFGVQLNFQQLQSSALERIKTFLFNRIGDEKLVTLVQRVFRPGSFIGNEDRLKNLLAAYGVVNSHRWLHNPVDFVKQFRGCDYMNFVAEANVESRELVRRGYVTEETLNSGEDNDMVQGGDASLLLTLGQFGLVVLWQSVFVDRVP